MDIVDGGVEKVRKMLPKVIDAKTHGLIDYAHAGLFLTLALVWRRKNPAAARAALGTGAFVLVQSLLTDYPLGWKPVLSFEEHGKLDGAFATLSPLVPNVFGFEHTPEASVFRINGVVEGTVVSMTEWDSTVAALATR